MTNDKNFTGVFAIINASRKDYKKTGLKNGLFQALAKY